MRLHSLVLACLLAATILIAGCGGHVQAEDAAPPAPAPGFDQLVVPFLKQHCLECHAGTEPDGDLSLDSFRSREAVVKTPAIWREARSRLQHGEMPPEDQPRPDPAMTRAVIAWISGVLAEARAKSGSDPGRVTLRRLNRTEYNYTVQDLLDLDLSPADAFPDDNLSWGFDTNGDALSIPPLLMERYLSAAETLAAAAIVDFKPLRQRVEAEAAERIGSKGGQTRNGLVWVVSQGGLAIKVKVPWAGEYVISARACGQQAGPEPVKMGFGADGRPLGDVEVPQTPDKPAVHQIRVKLEPGLHEISVSFLNDYYRPTAINPRQRDRNMAVDWIEIRGPSQPPAMPRSHRMLIQEKPRDGSSEEILRAARAMLAPLATRAFRRPVRAAELQRLVNLVAQTMGEGESFERGLQLALTAVLVSPSFLFRFEIDPAPHDSKAIHPLSEHELATRLSYFLWCSLPDDELVAHASAGTLRANLERQVRRMLDDPRSSRLVESFGGQWLQLRRLDSASPDVDRFMSFDEDLRAAMRTETEMLLETILRENRSILELLDARFTFVNRRLARHYGMRWPWGDESPDRYRRVRVPAQRGGILGHASILTITSNPTRTSPVKRGKWILEVLLDDPPPPPLPGMDSLQETPAMTGKSLRERMETHRKLPACAICHEKLDPLGFGLEHFDAVGAWRRLDGKHPIDASGVLPGGKQFAGLQGLQIQLRKRDRDLAQGLLRQLLIYALGRGPVASDIGSIEDLVERLAPEWRLADIIVEVTKLNAFQSRRGEELEK